ncbi:hypothetical protein BDZ89DRAFT_716743 [Hymenopellis radicata]|nr:hypothetical protein BDZ89DRAFT_716743 [Hymenopellis radicata]
MFIMPSVFHPTTYSHYPRLERTMGNKPPLLPLEITDSVIDEVDQFRDLHARVVTLSTCALVCRQWRSRARWRLFDVVAFNSGEQRMHAFRNLLSNPHCTILSSVRLVQAELRMPWGRAVAEILSDLSVLRGLTTFDLSATRLDSECFANYRSLKTLVLTACTFSTCRDAARIIGGCLGLEALTVSYCTLGDDCSHADRPNTPIPLAIPPRLKRLVLENSEPKRYFLSWLCTGESSLEDLRVRTVKSGDLPVISALARHAGSKLVHLTIGLPVDASSNADAILGSEELLLQTCTSLRSITLENVPPRAAHAVTFLARMRCRHVEELTLAFGLVDLSSNKISFFPWMQLGVVLGQPSLGSLERLCVSGGCSPSEMLVIGEALKGVRTRWGPLEIIWI